jgi:hypothetical protein
MSLSALVGFGRKKTAGFGKIVVTITDAQPDHKIIENSHCMTSLSNSETGLVSMKGHILAVMQTAFNPPVTVQ